jgi:sulfopyruvate decarboxylase subunit alpha
VNAIPAATNVSVCPTVQHWPLAGEPRRLIVSGPLPARLQPSASSSTNVADAAAVVGLRIASNSLMSVSVPGSNWPSVSGQLASGGSHWRKWTGMSTCTCSPGASQMPSRRGRVDVAERVPTAPAVVHTWPGGLQTPSLVSPALLTSPSGQLAPASQTEPLPSVPPPAQPVEVIAFVNPRVGLQKGNAESARRDGRGMLARRRAASQCRRRPSQPSRRTMRASTVMPFGGSSSSEIPPGLAGVRGRCYTDSTPNDPRPDALATVNGFPADRFVDRLEAVGFDFFAGVPCSLVKTLIAELERRGRYHGETREDAALGVAAGAYLAGRTPVVVMQNSGLGVSLNALGSLHLLYRMPCLLVVTWRGHEGKDAPEHLVMGDVLPRLLDLFGIPFRAPDGGSMLAAADWAATTIGETRRPVALVVRPGLFEG